MARLGLLVLLFGLLSRCGGGAVTPPTANHRLIPSPPVLQHLVLRPGEHRTFRPGVLRPGDVVTCVVSGGKLRVRIPNRPYGGWAIGKGKATPAGQHAELQLRSAPDGSVTATCR